MMKWKNVIKGFVGNISINVTTFLYYRREKGFVGSFLFISFEKLLSILNLSIYPVVDAKLYSTLTDNIIITDIEKNRKGIAGNIIMAGSEEPTNMTESDLPDLQLYCYKKVCLQGNSDVVVDRKNRYVISEAGYNLSNNEEVVDGLLYRTRNNVCLLRDNLKHKKEHISAGIMVSGKFCHNFYHLMYENLIRLVFIDKLIIPDDIPIIVDRKSLSIPSCKKIFDILTEDNNREVILIDSHIIYDVDTLYCLSRVNKFPAHTSSSDLREVEYLYYAPALRLLRERLIKYKSDRIFPRRVFITRASSRSRHFNEEEVFETLKPYGFEMVAPEKYSFEEQIALFNQAEYIVGGSGAAFSNLLFVDIECTAIIFTRGTCDKIIELPVFNTIANVMGARVVFYPNMNSGSKNIHVNYSIDCGRFSEMIKKVIKL